jgi:hypothetical protein
MKMLVTALAFSAAVPLTAHASLHARIPAGGQHIVARPHIYWQRTDLGTDPDPNIRFQMRRDADLTASNH